MYTIIIYIYIQELILQLLALCGIGGTIGLVAISEVNILIPIIIAVVIILTLFIREGSIYYYERYRLRHEHATKDDLGTCILAMRILIMYIPYMCIYMVHT